MFSFFFFQTTDSNWNPKIIKENVTQIYKVCWYWVFVASVFDVMGLFPKNYLLSHCNALMCLVFPAFRILLQGNVIWRLLSVSLFMCSVSLMWNCCLAECQIGQFVRLLELRYRFLSEYGSGECTGELNMAICTYVVFCISPTWSDLIVTK